MTVPAAPDFISYTADSITVNFTVPFYFINSTDLLVKVNGIVKVLGVDYTVIGAGNPSGGTVTFNVAPTSPNKVFILNSPPISQTSNYVNFQTLLEQTLMLSLDKLTIISQLLNFYLQNSLQNDTTLNTPSWQGQGLELQNLMDGQSTKSAATVEQIQAIVAAAGSVPSPLLGQVGQYLKATAVGVFNWFDLLNAANIWGAEQSFITTAVSPIVSRRTESDSTTRTVFSGQRGNGSGNLYNIRLTDDGANNVIDIQEFIGATQLRRTSATSNEFPLPIDLDEIATPAVPGASKLRIYAKAGLPALWNREGASGAELLIHPSLAGAKGLVITNNAVTPNTKVDITVAQAILTDSNGIPVFYSGGTLTINMGVNGANGLDTGAFTASQQYYSYLIYNPSTNTFASLASLSSMAPTLPSGYVHFMRVGAMISDNIPNLYRFMQRGDNVQYMIVPATNTAAYLAATSKGASTAATSFVVSNAVPPTAKSVRFNGVCSAANSWAVGPNGQIAVPPASAVDLINPSASVAQGSILPFDMQFETAQTAFIATGSVASTTTIVVEGYRDAVNAT